jgi:hypothetical protein
VSRKEELQQAIDDILLMEVSDRQTIDEMRWKDLALALLNLVSKIKSRAEPYGTVVRAKSVVRIKEPYDHGPKNLRFNFRDMVKRLGLPETKEVHWGIDQRLRAIASELGYDIERPLTVKTDPNPKVAAKHRIASYPMAMFGEAIHIIRAEMAETQRQMDLFQ